MPAVTMPKHKKGDYFVDYEEKVFEDVKAKPGEKALVTFHTVAFEGSIGFVNLLQATRLLRKGFETSVLLYGPGVTLGVQRGFPLHHAALDVALRVGLGVPLDHVHAFDDEAVLVRDDAHDPAALAAVLPGRHDDVVVLSNRCC